ncbi:hypothetical protein COB55_03590 [Candidatus Wolfebacteria bacterium]|nr:MAG: hypothetical protein COB55_03590 [Candidatus Wolfebacteria bacterium]
MTLQEAKDKSKLMTGRFRRDITEHIILDGQGEYIRISEFTLDIWKRKGKKIYASYRNGKQIK